MKRERFEALRGRVNVAMVLIAAFLVPLQIAPVAAAEVTVIISETLEPAQLTVAPGTTVRWENRDGERHRVRSDDGPVRFDSGNLSPGDSYAFRFDVAGSYPYQDERNEGDPAYAGSIVVSAETVPPTQPGPGGDAPGGGGEAPAPISGDVTIVDDSFRPRTIEVAVGGTVTWANRDREHTVTARDRSWDSGVFDAGGSYSQTFNAPGTVSYLCLIHPEMTGTVTVTGRPGGADGSPGAPEAPPADAPSADEPAQDGGGAPPAAAPPPPPPGATAIRIEDFAFAPRTVSIPTGTEVVWTNAGQAPHTVTADGGSFDSGILSEGGRFGRVFRSAGTYAYLCTLHPEMTGTVTVTGATVAGTDPPAQDQAPTGEETQAETPEDEGADDPPGAAEATGAITVAVIDLDFDPRRLEVPASQEVRWRNDGELPHTVTATDGSFDSGIMQPGDTFDVTFSDSGTFRYVCALHPDMLGVVTVTAAGPLTAAPGAVTQADDGPGGLVAGVLVVSVLLAGATVLTVWRVRTNAARGEFG